MTQKKSDPPILGGAKKEPPLLTAMAEYSVVAFDYTEPYPSQPPLKFSEMVTAFPFAMRF